MIVYLIKSILCMLLLLTAYRLLLEKEKMLRFNRFFLLASLVFSLVVPLLHMGDYLKPPGLDNNLKELATGIGQLTTPAMTAGDNTARAVPAAHTIPYGFPAIVYGLVTIALLGRYCRNLYLIHRRIAVNHHIDLKGARLVLVPEPILSHTFYKSIFINETDFNEQRIEKEVLLHEMAHVQQRHTFDVLFVELLMLCCWFNPLLSLYKRAIQLNHEFLADQSVTDVYADHKAYQYLLISKAGPANHLAFSSPLNFNITKKRLIMITRTYNRRNAWIKSMFLLPLTLVAFFLFSTNTSAQEQNLIGMVTYERTVSGTDDLGAHPYVEIDGKEYPSDILEKISPSCLRSTSIFRNESAIFKFGNKAADGAVIISLSPKGLSYVTATERENLAKERAAKTGFYHRITLKKEDGSLFDKLFINYPSGKGSINASGAQNCKVAFLVNTTLYREDQIDELEKVLKAAPNLDSCGVGGNTVKQAPGLDLSSYEMVFYFVLPPHP